MADSNSRRKSLLASPVKEHSLADMHAALEGLWAMVFQLASYLWPICPAMELLPMYIHAITLDRQIQSHLRLLLNTAMVLCKGEYPILSNNKF